VNTIPAGTVLLLPVRVVYEIEQTDGGHRMLVRLADLKATKEIDAGGDAI
jgi:hypothetical protein